MKMILFLRLAIMMTVAFSTNSAAAPANAPEFALSIPAARSGGQPLDGRMLLLLSNDPSAEPRMQISLSPNTQMVFGVDVDSLPPGQIVTRKWPVLHSGIVPAVDLGSWRFAVTGAHHSSSA